MFDQLKLTKIAIHKEPPPLEFTRIARASSLEPRFQKPQMNISRIRILGLFYFYHFRQFKASVTAATNANLHCI